MGIRRTAAEYGAGISDESLTVSSTAVALTVPTGSLSALMSLMPRFTRQHIHTRV
jgi:hypothetical protein